MREVYSLIQFLFVKYSINSYLSLAKTADLMILLVSEYKGPFRYRRDDHTRLQDWKIHQRAI